MKKASSPKRPKQKVLPAPSEAVVHAAVVQHLVLRAPPTVYWYHVPNGEKRDAVTGARLKKLGVRAGVPDLALVIGGRAHFLELKRLRGGRLSPSQAVARDLIAMSGATYSVAHGIDEALHTLESWGALGSIRRLAA